MSSASVRLHTLDSLFNINLGVLVDHLRAPLAQPMRLQLPNGRLLHASPRVTGALQRLTGLGEPLPASSVPLATEVPVERLAGLPARRSGPGPRPRLPSPASRACITWPPATRRSSRWCARSSASSTATSR
jgi:hypothetical protein